MRTWLRSKLFSFVGRILASDDGRDLLFRCLRGRLGDEAARDFAHSCRATQPYPELPPIAKSETCGEAPIFITGRFRSGTTLLWNLFRHMPNCTAYYEPLNERRWFDKQSRGDHTDRTHRQVDDYWSEYDGLGVLAQFYDEDWIRRDLYMPAGHWNPNLKRYLEILIEQARGRAALQFNRVDFRLPWLRANFPKAKIVHLYRHPRDQWLSTLYGDNFPVGGNIAEFAAHDTFYLLSWARDLKHRFPFVDETRCIHPYRLFYYVWKLSYLFGRRYSHISLAFEDLIKDPQQILARISGALKLHINDFGPLLKLVEPPRLGRWQEYASDDWFFAHETECERELSEFLAIWRDTSLGASDPFLEQAAPASGGHPQVLPYQEIA